MTTTRIPSIGEPLARILERLPSAKNGGEGWMALCPAHPDHQPSLSLRAGEDGRVLLHCFAGCSVESIVGVLGLEMKDLFPDSGEKRKIKPYPEERVPVTLSGLSRRTGLPKDFLTAQGLLERAGAVVVPYLDREGQLLHHKLRVALEGKAKYRYEKGAQLAPYGLWRFAEAEKYQSVVLVEGESDAWTLWYHGIPALGLPGASHAKVLDVELLMGLDSLFLVQEGDEAGARLVTTLGQQLTAAGFGGKIYVVAFSPKTKDPNELYLQLGANFKNHFREMCNRAPELGEGTIADLMLCMADVEPTEVSWLWYPYIPRGSLTVIGGKPGLGKSYFTCGLAAHLASGQRLPGASESSGPHPVFLFAAEDDPRTVIHTRLTGAGADHETLKRIFVFDLERHDFTFEGPSFRNLEKMIEHHKPKLVIFDPFVSFAGSKVDLHRQNEVRALLAPLMRIAAKADLAIVLIVHVKKGSVSHAMDSLVGSVDFSAAVRSALLVYPDPRDPNARLLAHAKHNLTAPGETLRFTLRGGFSWAGTSDLVADELAAIASIPGESSSLEEAKHLLRVELADGKCESRVVSRIAREHGLSNSTLCRARKELGILSKKESYSGPWLLVWPEGERQPWAQEVEQNDVPF